MPQRHPARFYNLGNIKFAAEDIRLIDMAKKRRRGAKPLLLDSLYPGFLPASSLSPIPSERVNWQAENRDLVVWRYGYMDPYEGEIDTAKYSKEQIITTLFPNA